MPSSLDEAIAAAVQVALREDLGPDYAIGDITTEAVIGERAGRAVITLNQNGIIAGLTAAAAVFAALDPNLRFSAETKDGERTDQGRIIARLQGDLKAILKGERSALNFLSRLGGIATLTGKYVEAVSGTGAEIYDTRKTTPGLRALEKYAVRLGGGRNHRFGLFDGVLIKDNHLVGWGVREALAAARNARTGYRLEVEVETLDQLKEAIEAGADMVMLDNMSLDLIAAALDIAKDKVEIEISGGVTLENVAALAAVGARRISVGALTQSAPALDFSLTVQSG